jgi:hypothetical protein
MTYRFLVEFFPLRVEFAEKGPNLSSTNAFGECFANVFDERLRKGKKREDWNFVIPTS